MTKLSVNVNKIATLRNSRGGNVPNLISVVQDIERFGADGITVHPRPDQRHIKKTDVFELKKVVSTPFNIEGYPSDDFVQLVLKVSPELVTLVPDAPDALTSNAGWNTKKNLSFLTEIISEFKKNQIPVSLFLENNLEYVDYALKTEATCIELYTEEYSKMYTFSKKQAIEPYKKTAFYAHSIGLKVHAGHDLNMQNLAYLVREIPIIDEVSIGHALISDALYFGLENTIQLYKKELNTYYA